MPFIVDDKFHSHAKVVALSLAARGLWTTAGAWSSDHRRGGFVPDRVLASFGSTPELEDELRTAGLWERARRGIRFHDWERWNDTAETAEQKAADADRKKELAAERQRRKRAKDKAEARAASVTAVTRDTVPGMAPELPGAGLMPGTCHAAATVTVTRPEYTGEKEPQVEAGAVTRDISVTGSVTPPSDDLDFDFDLGLSQSVSQVEDRNAGARARGKPPEPDPEPYTPEFRLQVQFEMAGRDIGDVTDAEADDITAEVLGRAKEPVPHPWGYVRKAIRGEKNPRRRWLSKRAPAPAPTLARFRPAPGPHDFARDPETGLCRCKQPEQDKVHKTRLRQETAS